MKRHLNKKNIISMLENSLPEKKNRKLNNHINECKSCREKYENARLIFTSSDNSLILPPENIEKEIIHYIRSLKIHEASKTEKNRLSFILKPALITAALFLVVSISFILNRTPEELYSPVNLTVSKFSGEFSVNSKKIKSPAQLKKGDILQTAKASSMLVKLDSLMSIRIMPDSEIKISESKYSEKNNHYLFAFDLKNGRIHSIFNHKGITLDYSYNTAFARIESTGTEFLITAKKKYSQIVLKNGTIEITSLKTGKSLLTSKPGIYTVTSKIDYKKFTERKTHNKVQPETVKEIQKTPSDERLKKQQMKKSRMRSEIKSMRKETKKIKQQSRSMFRGNH